MICYQCRIVHSLAYYNCTYLNIFELRTIIIKIMIGHVLNRAHFYYILGLCEMETGQGNIVLDIEESRGSRKYIFFFNKIQFVKAIKEDPFIFPRDVCRFVSGYTGCPCPNGFMLKKQFEAMNKSLCVLVGRELLQYKTRNCYYHHIF